jgi:hypothetical protein
VVLDLDAGTYERSKQSLPLCHPAAVIDLRWLGRAQGDVKGELLIPDTSMTLLGVRATPVDIRFPTRQSGGSTIRIWFAADLATLFGPGWNLDLCCGVPIDEAATAMAALLAKQFQLSSADRLALCKAGRGYPIRIETYLGQGAARIELSCFETLSIDHSALTDSTFAIPAKFRPAGSATK